MLDLRRWEDLRALLTDGFTFFRSWGATSSTTEPLFVGADSYIKFVADTLCDGISVHLGTPPEIELTGPRRARGVCAVHDVVENPSRGAAFRGFGHCHDEYEMGDDSAWRISSYHLIRIHVDGDHPDR